MSELPKRLQDSGTGPRATVQIPQARKLGLFVDERGCIAWHRNDFGVYELPTLAGYDDSVAVCVEQTPPGFSRRWKSTVVRSDAPAPDNVLWCSGSDVLEQWRTGEALVDPTALRALQPRLVGHPIAYGVWNVPMRTQTLPPATHTNGYLVGDGTALLVDPGGGDPREVDSVVAFVRQWVVRNGSLSAIWLTHHHQDHVSGANQLREQLGVPIWAHAETANRVTFPIDRLVTDGERFGPWTALHTPGHAPGHLCLWHEGRKLLMAGDMIASVGTIVIDPPDGDMQAYLKSLHQLRALEARVLYPAHGEPILNTAQRLDGYVAHRLWREAQIFSVLSETGQTLESITRAAYTDVPEGIHWLAQRQALAHLTLLVDSGRARRVEDQWSLSSES